MQYAEPDKTYALQVYCNEKTKSGVSKTYSFLESLIDAGSDLDSMEEILKRQNAIGSKMTKEQAMLNAMKIYFSGTVEPFEFLDNKGDFVSNLKIKASYLGNAQDSFEPLVKFDVELYIEEMVGEKDENGDSTGRGLIKGIIPLYSGKVANLTLVADAESKNTVFAKYDIGKTVDFWGEIVVNVTEVKSANSIDSNDVAFGQAPNASKVVNYKTELMLTGGLNPYSMQNELAYSKEEIIEAKQARENLLEENKERYDEEKKNAPTAQNNNVATNSEPKKFKFF